MSIYFYHVVLAFLAVVFCISLLTSKRAIKFGLLPFFVGVCGGLLIFSITKKALLDSEFKAVFDIFIVVVVALLPLLLIYKNALLKSLLFFPLGVGYGFEYGVLNSNFPLFVGELLDSVGFINLFLTIFAFVVVVFYFLILQRAKEILNRTSRAILVIFVCAVLIVDRAGFFTLYLMHKGLIKKDPELLSIVAKIVYANGFFPYIFALLGLIVVAIYLFSMPKKVSKEDIVSYRTNLAAREQRIINSTIFGLCAALVISFSAYFKIIAQAPPRISTPIIVEPVDGVFKFDAKIVLDGKLHRFAYITDQGREIRFFLINRFNDRLSPTAVFDACSICGDMGYIKRGDDLICISCNVRIFLPTVGKFGGCNPIPLEFKFDGENITITLEEIENGASFFSKDVEKMVTDPVSLKKIKNNSKFNYLYYNRTYFFENEENQEKFEANPEKYVTTKGEILGGKRDD